MTPKKLSGQRMPGIGSLVASGTPSRGRNAAIIGGPWESDSALAMGFFDIADLAMERWKAGHRNDNMVIPIIYNYRHGIELALKAGIREAASCLRGDGVTDTDVQAAAIEEWMSTTHSIANLVNKLTALLDRLPLRPGQRLAATTDEFLHKLHILDDSGQAFRYVKAKKGQRGAKTLERIRPSEERFDLVDVAEALHDAGTGVLFGLSGVLNNYAENQADWRAYMGSW